MSLVRCPECGRERVSSTALACPDCGFNVKKYYESNPQEVSGDKSVVYCDLFSGKNESIFTQGLDDGSKGICKESLKEYEYNVVDNILFITRNAGTVSYLISGDYLINENSIFEGAIPEGNRFGCSCIGNNPLGGKITTTFWPDGRYTEISKLLGKDNIEKGTYKRNGDLIVIKGPSNGNIPYGCLINDNIFSKNGMIRKDKVYLVHDLFDAINNKDGLTATIRCPYCNSESFQIVKQGFGAGKAAIGGALLGPIGLLGGAIGSNKIKRICDKCGKEF